MKIGITMRTDLSNPYKELRDAISHDWIKYLSAENNIIIPLPNLIHDSEQYFEQLGIDVLLLSNGNDLVPREGYEADVSQERNEFESGLIKSALDRGIKVFGCCRGLHVINNYFGGNIISDLKTCGGIDHAGTTHLVELNAPFNKIIDSDYIEVNSYHNQGIMKSNIANDLKVFATSNEDTVVEGIFHSSLPVLAIQWHPERNNPADTFDRKLINKFFEEGKFW